MSVATVATRVLSKGEEKMKKAKGKVGKKDSSKFKDATKKAHTTRVYAQTVNPRLMVLVA